MGSARLSWFWEERVPGRERAGVKATMGAHSHPRPGWQSPTCWDKLGAVGLPPPGPREARTGWQGGGAGPEGALCPRYSAEAQAMQQHCTCCQETRAHQQPVTMQCRDGTAVQSTYTHVDACGCVPSCAPSPAAPEGSTPVLLSEGAPV